MIAKKVRTRTKELEILQYLRMHELQSKHVISLVESIPTTSGREWAIFPKLNSLGKSLGIDGRLRGKLVQLGWDLVNGLAHLHRLNIAHLDIKPDNLLYDDACRLQITDFDVAVRVKDEDEEIDKYVGTDGWMAPEIRKRNELGVGFYYKPIKADRWSCGKVLLGLMNIERDTLLLTYATQLMVRMPDHRPSLLEWRKWSLA